MLTTTTRRSVKRGLRSMMVVTRQSRSGELQLLQKPVLAQGVKKMVKQNKNIKNSAFSKTKTMKVLYCEFCLRLLMIKICFCYMNREAYGAGTADRYLGAS